jgi:hypothetical protein
MTKHRFGTAALVLGLLVSVGAGIGVGDVNLVPQAIAADAAAQTPALAPGMARVWFLRTEDSANGAVYAAAPIIYANGAPVGDIPVGADFFRDYPAGTYRFTVQSYGLPTGQADTVQLAPGTQTYLEIEWLASWEEGYPEAGYSFAPNTFGILQMSPELAQAYLPTLASDPQ